MHIHAYIHMSMGGTPRLPSARAVGVRARMRTSVPAHVQTCAPARARLPAHARVQRNAD